jgi:hypothetical protein
MLDFINNYIGALANLLLVWEMLMKPFIKWVVMLFLRKSMKKDSACVTLALSVEGPQDRLQKLNNMVDFMRKRLPLPYKNYLDDLNLESLDTADLINMSSYKIYSEEYYRDNQNLIELNSQNLKMNLLNQDLSTKCNILIFLLWKMSKNADTYKSYVDTGNFFNESSSKIYKEKGNSMLLVDNCPVRACGCGNCETYKVLYWTSNESLGCHAFSEHCEFSFNNSPFRVPVISLTTFECYVKKETQLYWVYQSVRNTFFAESEFDLKSIFPRWFNLIHKGEMALLSHKFGSFEVKMSEDIAGYTMPGTDLTERKEFMDLILISQKYMKDRCILEKIIYSQKSKIKVNAKIAKMNFNMTLLNYKKLIYACSEVFSITHVPSINRLSNSEANRLNVKIISLSGIKRSKNKSDKNKNKKKVKSNFGPSKPLINVSYEEHSNVEVIVEKIREVYPKFQFDEKKGKANITPSKLAAMRKGRDLGFNKFFIEKLSDQLNQKRNYSINNNLTMYQLYVNILNRSTYRAKSKKLSKKEFDKKILDLNYNNNHKIMNFIRQISGLEFKPYKRNKMLTNCLSKPGPLKLTNGKLKYLTMNILESKPVSYMKEKREILNELNDINEINYHENQNRKEKGFKWTGEMQIEREKRHSREIELNVQLSEFTSKEGGVRVSKKVSVLGKLKDYIESLLDI